MPPSTLARKAYQTVEASTLSPRDLLVKLYQGIERFLLQAKMGMQNRRLDLAVDGCRKAKAIIIELCSTLNFEQGGDIAQRLRDLYIFLLAEITRASLDRDTERIEKLLPIIATLRSAWEAIPQEYAHVTSLSQGQQTFSVRG